MRAAVAIGLSVSAFGWCAAVGAETTDRVAFDATSRVALSTTKAVPIVVVNNSVETHTLTVSASIENGADRTTTIAVPSAAPAMITAGGNATISVGPMPKDATAGTGWIVVTATPPGGDAVVIRRVLTFGTTDAKPLVSAWTATKTVTLPWTSRGRSHSPLLPLDQQTCDGVSAGTAFVQSGSRITEVPYSCQVANDRANLAFDLDKVKVGSFEGKLTFGEKDIGLKVQAAAAWAWPLIVIVFGLLVVTAQQAWTTSLRPIQRARARADDIAIAAKNAQANFTAGAPIGPRRYDIVDAVAREASVLRGRLTALRPPWAQRWFFWWYPTSKAVDEDEYTAVIKDMTELDSTVKAWPAVAADFDQLRIRVGSLSETQAAIAPFLVSNAKSLVPDPGMTDPVILTLERARDLIVTVPKTVTALALLPVVEQLGDRLRRVSPAQLPPEDQQVLASARHRLRRAAGELAEAADAGAVEAADVGRLLAEVRHFLLDITEPGNLPSPTAAGLQAVWTGAPFGGIRTFMSKARRAIASLFGERSTLRTVDGIWLFVALGIVVWSGLSANYVNKAWGTATDFVSLLVWVVGGTAVLTQLFSGLENLTGAPLRLKPPASPKADAPDA